MLAIMKLVSYIQSHECQTLHIGGGQEHSLRSGTENLEAIIDLDKAANIAQIELEDQFNHMNKLHVKALLASNHHIEIA